MTPGSESDGGSSFFALPCLVKICVDQLQVLALQPSPACQTDDSAWYVVLVGRTLVSIEEGLS